MANGLMLSVKPKIAKIKIQECAIVCRQLPYTGTVMASYYFVIVGTKDNPIFECEFGAEHERVRSHLFSKVCLEGALTRQRDETRQNQQFAVHSALDTIEELMWGTSQMYVVLLSVACAFLCNHCHSTVSAAVGYFLIDIRRNLKVVEKSIATDHIVSAFVTAGNILSVR